jgi:sensor histidine kinase regulating citrate/malate metabolism
MLNKNILGLREKIVLAMVLILILFMGLFFYYFLNSYRKQKINDITKETTRVSTVIAIGLKDAMLRRNFKLLNTIIKSIVRHQNIEKVFIVNKNGTVKISSQNKEVGKKFSKKNPTCQMCHRFNHKERNKTIIYKSKDGVNFFRNVTPIHNEKNVIPVIILKI